MVASCSRIAPVKRVYLIARLLSSLNENIPVHWHHFGGGHCDETEREVKKLRDAGAKVDMHGYTPNSEVRRFYADERVDLFINLSSSEGIPVSIMEALSANIPVIATDVKGTPEAVLDSRSGMLFSHAQVEQSSDCADEVFEKIKNGYFDGLNPKCVWAERFDASQNFMRLAAFLETEVDR